MKRIAMNCILASAALLALTVAPVLADNYSPTLFASATVDGDPSEWNLPQDFFANMYRAGKADKPLESKVYLRYDCLTSTMYVLVLSQPGIPCEIIAGTAWVALNSQNNKVVLDSSGDNGIPPDFAFVGPGFDGNAAHALGYEASFQLAPGNYNLIVHVDVFDAGGTQTSATIGFPGTGPLLSVTCGPLGTESTTWGRVKSLMVR